jgi:asparagine synthase (glutamine-hydrolysing)
LTRLPASYVRTLTGLLRHVPDDQLWDPVAKLRSAAGSVSLLDSLYASPRGICIYDDASRDAILAPLVASTPGFRPTETAEFMRTDVPGSFGNPGDWLARLEQRGYLSMVLLRDIDAMSMAHSLEVRVPLLDRALTDLAPQISSKLKYRDGVGKWVFKHALTDLLPDEILFRPKMGFGLPYQVWMRRSLEPMVRDLLTPDRIRRRGLFDLDISADLLARFYAGDDNVWRRVWTLFAFEGWANEVLDTQVLDVAA